MNQVDIASSLFQIKKKVAEATEQAWEIEWQKLLVELNRTAGYGGGLEALLGEIHEGTKTRADYTVMSDKSIRPVAPPPVPPEEVIIPETPKEETSKTSKTKEVAGVT